MSKAALWNVNVGEVDTRDAGREPVRPRSQSLGEWLHGTASDNHAESDTLVSRVPEEIHEGREVALATSGRVLAAAGTDADRTAKSGSELVRAIEAIERRTQRNKRRADDALEPFNRILEQTGSERDRERVSSLADRVSKIETGLIDRFAPIDENPVRASIARLEARLDAFGRQQSVAEAIALQQAIAQLPKPAPQYDSLQRLEDKLDAILKAIQTRTTETSAIALAASQSSRRWGDRRLGDAIDDISRRQQALDFEEGAPLRQTAARNIERAMRAPKRVATEDISSFAAIRSEIAGLATKLDGLCRDVSTRREPVPTSPAELDLLRCDIDNMSDAVLGLAPRVDLSAAIDSVAGLGQCISTAPDIGVIEATREALISVVDDTRNALIGMDGRSSAEALVERLEALTQKVYGLDGKTVDADAVIELRRLANEITGLVATLESKPPLVDRVDYLIGSMKWLLDTRIERSDADFQATITELRDLIANPPSQVTFVRIETALEALDAEATKAVTRSAQASKDAHRSRAELEDLVLDLSQKMEAVQAPGASHETLTALQDQIALLSSRFESADDGFAKLNALQQSMQEIFAHLEQTRASVETSAAQAAREVLRIAIEDGQATQRDVGLAERLAQIQTVQDEAEARNGSALSAVQQALTKVVDRLSSMESEIAEVRVARNSPIPAKVNTAPLGEISLGTPVSLLDESPEKRSSEKTPAVVVAAPTKPAVETDGEDGKADFIAAARRAAKAVHATIPVIDIRRPLASNESKVRTFLIEEAHDYVARHKKPVLLGMAALFVIIGTLSVAHRVGLARHDAQQAAIAPRIHVAATTEPAALSPKHTPAADLPSAKAASDTTTAAATSGSAQPEKMAALPVFATRAPTPPRIPTIPVKLKTMADAGDPGAQYVLGTQYAEGRGVARNFETAAGLYQKAADKGIVPAQYRLASLFEKGLGVGKDKAKARSLYMQAAEAGNPRAMHNLAVLLADGDGKPDYEGAANWFRKAAQYGMEDSQYNLAILLARGLGVQQSLVQSYQWFAIAASQDDPEAAKKRDEVGTKLGGADLAVAKALAASFRPRTVSVAAIAVQPPPGGWDGASTPSPLKSARSKISSL